jgi:Glycine-zipper domain
VSTKRSSLAHYIRALPEVRVAGMVARSASAHRAGGLDRARQKATLSDVSNAIRNPIVVLGVLAAVAACASPRPILYPNAHLSAVGQAQADADLADCQRLAETAGASAGATQGGQAARDAAVGGAIGGAAGAAGGAVLGRPATGAAFGAATGATANFMRSLFRRDQPSQAYRSFVDRCLRERGYEPVGWE